MKPNAQVLTLGCAAVIAVAPLDWTTKLLAMVIVLGPLYYLARKTDRQTDQTDELHRLRAAYEQLDQQAKLVIRTDLELHRTQEELDRKLTSLFALHELGQQLRISLQPNEIYGKLTAQFIESLGFSKGLIGMCAHPNQLQWSAVIGVEDHTAAAIREHALASGWLRALLANPAPKTLTISAALDADSTRLLDLLSTTKLVVAGIAPQTGPAGCLVLVHEGLGTGESRGDEELVAILTDQVAVAVENSALYEELWSSRRDLERNIQERTRELAEANAELIRLNKAKSDFVSAVSHELRTPLAAIKGYASLLRSGQFGALVAAQTERLAKIEKHTDLLAQLINNLLDIARIESGRVTMDSRPIDVQELLTTVVETVKPQLDAKRITLTVHADGVARLQGDPTHLPRVFMNLLSNALKYTPEGGAITVTIQREGPMIRSTVQDTGCGMTPEEQAKLFEEFYRAPNRVNEQVRGTGLGLALVKRIIAAHQGHISVQSESGKGTSVSFMLPTSA